MRDTGRVMSKIRQKEIPPIIIVYPNGRKIEYWDVDVFA